MKNIKKDIMVLKILMFQKMKMKSRISKLMKVKMRNLYDHGLPIFDN